MLVRYLSQSHIVRTARLALPRLKQFHTSSLPRQNNSDNISAPLEPTLDWSSGEDHEDYTYGDHKGEDCHSDDHYTRPPVFRDSNRRKIRVELNPVLGWSSGQRTRNNDNTRKALGVINTEPELRWLTNNKNVLEPKLCWSSELSEGLGEPLRKAKFQLVKRRKSQAGGPRLFGDGLVRRYTVESEPGVPVRRTRSHNWKSVGKWELESEAQKTKFSGPEGGVIRDERDLLEIQGAVQEELVGEQEVKTVEQETLERQEAIKRQEAAEKKALGNEQRIKIKHITSKKNPSTEGGVHQPEADLLSRSEGLKAPKTQEGSGLIRNIASRGAKPRIPGSIVRIVKTNTHHTEIRIRGFVLKPQKEEEDQATINTSTEKTEGSTGDIIPEDINMNAEEGIMESALGDASMEAEGSIGEAVPNNTDLVAEEGIRESVLGDASMKAEGSIGEAVPNDTNLVVEENGREAGSNATTTEKEPHDLKRTNPSPGGLLGPSQNVNPKSGKKRKLLKGSKEGSTEVVLNYDIEHLLSSLNICQEGDTPLSELPEVNSEIRLKVSELSSLGDGLAVYKNRVYTVPFGVPGDQVNATVRYHNSNHSVAKINQVVMPSPNRDDSLVGCKYFGTCAGCQLQMLPYAVQLEHKRKVVQKAFKNFSDLPPELLPEVGETMPSPLQYGYRTKLTPHFNGPRRGGFKPGIPIPNIGFLAKDRKFNLDIEDCPIGTDVVRSGMKERREFVAENLLTAFKRGATLLLRESTIRTYLEDSMEAGLDVKLDGNGKKYTEKKVCITDSNARSIEYIGDLKFNSPAGSFFQNNNSILSGFTSYIRENLNLPVVKKAEGSNEVIETTERPKYLVDAYCGSGLFSITCGEGLERVWGIDVDKSSIASARKNALDNNIQNASFMDSPAENIFGKLTFPGSETSLIIDPPKKGCDKPFLDQLLDFAPKRVVYVSCNVHTQARDIGYILADERGKGYRIDSIRGCDFFPQTHHVEGVVVMTKVD